MLARHKRSAFSLACLIAVCFTQELAADPQARARKPVETTITQLIQSGARFSGKSVRVIASFHTDGIERSVLLEPNCGSKTSPSGEPQCSRGVAPVDSDKAESDPGNADLDRALAQSGRAGTMDKHITAEFTGIFRCVPSCAHPKWFKLEIERVENLKIEMKDLKPHRPTDQPNGTLNQSNDAPTSLMMRTMVPTGIRLSPTTSPAKNATPNPATTISRRVISPPTLAASCRPENLDGLINQGDPQGLTPQRSNIAAPT